MKHTFLCLAAILFANLGLAQNIYTTDGTLGANRTVTLNGKWLNFTPATASPAVGNLFMSATGNIGLGTTSPTSRFHINSGDIFINSGKLLIGTVANFSDATYNWGIKSDKPFMLAGTTFPLIEVRSTNPLAYGWGDFAVATGDGYFSDSAKKGDVILRGYTPGSMLLTNDASGDIRFATRANTTSGTPTLVQMVIDKNGNIGMCTTTPDSKLAVNGVIHAKEVLVDMIGWPDYVFEKGYDLPTLEEVEKSIIKDGHLVNIPSAQEVESNGVLLGDMNKKLLEKIEEMTLYMIEMNKELQELKSQLKKDRS